jgi:hypothetical protein
MNANRCHILAAAILLTSSAVGPLLAAADVPVGAVRITQTVATTSTRAQTVGGRVQHESGLYLSESAALRHDFGGTIRKVSRRRADEASSAGCAFERAITRNSPRSSDTRNCSMSGSTTAGSGVARGDGDEAVGVDAGGLFGGGDGPGGEVAFRERRGRRGGRRDAPGAGGSRMFVSSRRQNEDVVGIVVI